MSSRKTASEWFELVAAWEKSQMSAAAWCREQGLAYQSFIYWRQRWRELSDPGSALSGGARFCEILPTTASNALIVEIAGVQLHLERNFDPELLRQIVAALREA